MEGCRRPVSRVLYPSSRGRMVTIYLALPPAVRPAEVRFWRSDVTAAVKQPTRGRAGRPCPPIRPCSRWGLAAAASPQTAGRSYRPISPLSRHVGTVCFCATFRPRFRRTGHRGLGVTQHPAQRSPDFPPSRLIGTAATRSALPSVSHSSIGPIWGQSNRVAARGLSNITLRASEGSLRRGYEILRFARHES